MVKMFNDLQSELRKNINQGNFWLAVVVTLACSLLGKYLSGFPGLSLVGHLVIALILGMLFQLVRGMLTAVREGTGYIANRFLRAGIILMGFKLNLVILFTSGIKGFAIACIVTPITIFLIYSLCRLFKVDHTLSLLTGCGCGICGAAAVMGISAPAKAKTDQSVLAIAIVCILGTVFTLVEVFLYPLLHLTNVQFGVMAGASLHEIAHAVAAGAAAGNIGVDYAIITKLSRVLLLAPVAVIVGIIEARRNKTREGKMQIPIPWFMVGFICASAIGSLVPMPKEVLTTLVTLAYVLLGMAMAALGINVNFQVILKHGFRPFAAAIIGSIVLLGMAYYLSITFF